MGDANAFWSYTHRDNDAESGRITALAQDLIAEYELITGESVRVFVDRSDIAWGDEWQLVIDASLASITFFIPILTPRYFQSDDCRRELSTFARRASHLGVRELVMPILYVSFAAIEADPSPDELIELARSFQWENWTILRFEARDSPEYRRAVSRMAERLKAATAHVEQIDPATAIAEHDDETHDEPGFIDRVAAAETALVEWAGTLKEVQNEIESIGALTTARAEELRAAELRKKGLAARLPIYRSLAEDLTAPADRVQTLSNAFTSHMGEVDSGIKAIFEKVEEEVEDGTIGPDFSEKFGDFQDMLEELATSAQEGLGALGQMIEPMANLERQSRSLRPVLRKMRRGLSLLVDGTEIISDWVRLAEEFQERHGDQLGLF